MQSDQNIEASDRIELYNTIILAVTTLAVAWCSYQTSLWNGIQTFHLAESNKYGRLSQQTIIQSGQNKAMEEAMIIMFVDAAFSKDSSKVKYILRGVKPEMASILSNWLQSHPFEKASAPPHPMVMPEYEALMEKRMEAAKNMTTKSNEMYNAAQKANANADTYSLLVALLSTVMFLGAIVTKMVRPMPRLLLTVVSVIILVIVLIVCFQMPVALRGI